MDWLFGWLYGPIGSMLSWFSSLFGGSYALALLLYALLFKIVFLPFSVKQQKNQIKMAKLAPKIELIKAKYRGRTDQPTLQKQQQEIMELQQREGYSPFAGCLPLLLQLPVIIFLYDIIRNPLTHIAQFTNETIEAIRTAIGEAAKSVDQIGLISLIRQNENLLNGIEGFDASKIPSFDFFGLNLAETPNVVWGWLTLIPLVAAALTWLSMILTRKWNGNGMAEMQAQDGQARASMRMMDLMMPAMTLFFAFGFSGMLGIYWIYQSALGILQTFILSKAMPLPKYTEEELKEMRKAQKAAEKAQRAALKAQPKYRSLHYIDEDDYDELPAVKASEAKNDSKKNTGIDIPEIKD